MKSIVVLWTLFSLYQGLYANKIGCPPGWIKYPGAERCFFVSKTDATYENAMKYCTSKNSELAPPITCDEQYYLVDQLRMRRNTDKCRGKNKNCDEFWIGINNLSGNGWKSTKGVEFGTDGNCKFWARHFPRSNGSCVLMRYRGNNYGEWKNDDCNRKLKYACIKCLGVNFHYIAQLSECLRFIPNPKTWTEARKFCASLRWENFGAYLLRIRGPRKQKIVEDYLKPLLARKENQKCVKGRPVAGNIQWLGAQTQDPNLCGTPYVWRAPMEPDHPFIYSNWFLGKPNCTHKGDNCAVIAPGRDYKWEDANCASKLCFVCEF